MTATPSIDLPGWMAEQLSQASPDLLRQLVQTFAEALMSADADARPLPQYQSSADGPDLARSLGHEANRRVVRPVTIGALFRSCCHC